MYKNRVGILGSPESIAEDIQEFLLTSDNLDSRMTIILKDAALDLYAIQNLVEEISKYSYGTGSRESVYKAFNVYRSTTHLSRGVCDES